MSIGQRQELSGPHIERIFGVPNVVMEVIQEVDVSVREADYDVPTGVEVRYQDRLVLSASGQIWAGVWFTGANGPRGWNENSLDPKFPLTGSHPFCLIGRLDGRYFYVGDGVDRFYRGRGSSLHLRTNDDTPGNGSGAFTVTVQQWRKI